MAGKRASRKVLLVEGIDDKYVVEKLCERHNFEVEFDILDSGGFPELKKAIPLQARAEGQEALGVLIDGNENPAGRWDGVTYQLRMEGYKPPRQMASNGTIIAGVGRRPQVGVWLMPDNSSKGQLEDFVQELIPAGDPVWPLATDYIEGIPESERKFTLRKMQRAKVHAWLAAREEPRKMGLAIQAGDLDAHAQPAIRLINWLRRLFA